MKLYDDEISIIACAVLNRAASDYYSLKRRGKTSAGNPDEGVYTIAELENFFKSGYCDSLVHAALDNEMINGADFFSAVVS